MSPGRTAAWKANHVYGEPSVEAARGKRGKCSELFLCVLRYWYVAIIIFKESLTSLGQRESSRGDNGYSTPEQMYGGLYSWNVFPFAKHERSISG